MERLIVSRAFTLTRTGTIQMATKQKKKRAGSVKRAAKAQKQVAEPKGVVTQSLVQAPAVEALVQVMTEAEIEKAKALAFEWIASATARNSVESQKAHSEIARNNSEVTKNNAMAMFFGKTAQVISLVEKLLSSNLEVVNAMLRKKGQDLRAQTHQPGIPQQGGAPQQRPNQGPHNQGPRGPKGKPHPRAGQPGQRPMQTDPRPLTQNLGAKLQAATQAPETPVPAPATEPTPPQ